MPTSLHKEIRWVQDEIDLCKRMIDEASKEPRYGADQTDRLDRLRETLRVHEETLDELKEKLARGD